MTKIPVIITLSVITLLKLVGKMMKIATNIQVCCGCECRDGAVVSVRFQDLLFLPTDVMTSDKRSDPKPEFPTGLVTAPT